MEDKLDIIIALLRKLVDAKVTTNQNTIDPAVYIIAGDMQIPIEESILYELYVNKHKKMNINTPPVSKRIFNKVVLPEQLEPNMPTNSPFFISKLTLCPTITESDMKLT